MTSAGSPRPGAYLIFGLPGTGKSTLSHYLQHQQITAIDADRDRKLSDWVNLKTGRRVTNFPGFPLPANWYNDHRWQWDSTRLNEILKQYSGQAVFVCGSASNISDFFHLFRLRFALTLDNDDMEAHLSKRDPHRYNHHTPELAETLTWNDHFRETYAHANPIFINAKQPTARLAKQILDHCS